MNKHASRGCIDESSTTGNMGEDFTIDVLIVRATITEMIQVFMMRPFPSLEISFQIYKKYNNKNKIKIKIYFQHFNHHANVIKLYFPLLFFDFRCFSYVNSVFTEFTRFIFSWSKRRIDICPMACFLIFCTHFRYIVNPYF